jgi:hypothetical protein
VRCEPQALLKAAALIEEPAFQQGLLVSAPGTDDTANFTSSINNRGSGVIGHDPRDLSCRTATA